MKLQNTTEAILSLPRSAKRVTALTVDSFLCLFSVWVSFCLRFDDWVSLTGIQWAAVAGSFCALPIFARLGLYKAIFRYSGGPMLAAIARATLLYAILYGSVFTIVGVPGVPRTVGLIQPILLFLLVALSRVTASFWLGGAYHKRLQGYEQRVLIYGAGAAGRQLAYTLGSSPLRVTGFIDDDDALAGQTLHGHTIHHSSKLLQVIQKHDVTDVLLAIPSAPRRRRHEILEVIRKAPVAVRTLPDLTDLAQGRVQTSDIRDLDLEDLLGRDAVEPDPHLFERNIRNKVVLVTGAGGSIGSELCRQILTARPKRLLLVEISEPGLYAVHQELQRRIDNDVSAQTAIIPLLGSVCDSARMKEILSVWRPDTVYHAAAYKHVPLVEHNPLQGVGNNVFGTLTTAIAARDHGVQDFVLISTDKAVRPTNVMGTTKRLAELVLQAMAEAGSKTRFSMVRFGNVLGSSGSVVPLFREQLRNGGPVTITHPEITRYFMTIPEAAQLVIQAGAMAKGGEVFVLDMGEPVKIMDLARNIIELSGFAVRDHDNPDGDIEIEIVGLRPGEKLYEELLIGDNPSPTPHPRILQAREHHVPWEKLKGELKLLEGATANGDVPKVLLLLRNIVPEYRPEGGVVDWIHLERIAG